MTPLVERMALSDRSALLPKTDTPDVASPDNGKSRKKFFPVAGLAIAILVASAVVFAKNKNGISSTMEAVSTGVSSSELTHNHSNDHAEYGWYMYKVAFPTANGTSDDAFDFMLHHSGGSTCEKVSLGCSGYKITCTFGANYLTGSDLDRQIHYVHAPALYSQAKENDEWGVDGWQTFVQESMGNLTDFSAFMHNKVQLFVGDIDTVIEDLESSGYNLMKRLSVYEVEGTAGVAAHVSTQVEGKIWEFVGFPGKNTAGFTYWADAECPAAHKVDVNMTKLSHLLVDHTQTKGLRRNSSLWISVHTAASDIESTDTQKIFTDLRELTGAITSIHQSDHCKVVTVSSTMNTDNLDNGAEFGDIVTMKYVQNNNFQKVQVGKKLRSISDYEDYISRVHKKYLSKPEKLGKAYHWRNWDHWLDQHVGLKWTESSGCHAKNQAVTERLLEDDEYVGKRAIHEDGDHFYVGYEGTAMCIEYNTECHHGKGETNTCTCLKENSNELANASGVHYDCYHDDYWD